MSRLNWSSLQATGHTLIDKQHRAIFDCFNQLDRILYHAEEGSGRDALDKLMDEMAILVRENFETEEQLMIRHGYPAFMAHKNAHKELAKRAMTLIENKRTTQGSYATEFTQLAIDWSLYHIGEFDTHFVEFLRRIDPKLCE